MKYLSSFVAILCISSLGISNVPLANAQSSYTFGNAFRSGIFRTFQNADTNLPAKPTSRRSVLRNHWYPGRTGTMHDNSSDWVRSPRNRMIERETQRRTGAEELYARQSFWRTYRSTAASFNTNSRRGSVNRTQSEVQRRFMRKAQSVYSKCDHRRGRALQHCLDSAREEIATYRNETANPDEVGE